MLTIVNPANDTAITQIKAHQAAELSEKLVRAKNVQIDWADCEFLERAEVIQRFRQKLASQSQDCARITSEEMGKPRHQAEGEIQATLARIDWFLNHTARELKAERVHVEGKMIEEIHYEPLGVIGNISAWNFPYFVGSNVFIPALLCGNSVLYKPSEFTSLTGLKIGELLLEAGLPRDCLQLIIGGASIGQALCDLPIDGMFFTGSQATGEKIAMRLAPHFIRLGLELGGKDAAYICDDVDIKLAAEAVADGSFYNAGQSCCAVERIYVHQNIYDEFLSHFKAFTESLRVGDPGDSQTYMGPLARKEQIAILDDQVQDAIAKGAKFLVQGGARPGAGNYYLPTALIDVNADMKLMQDESFGPIIGIQKVNDDEQALSLMNENRFGLTNSVHSRDRERAIAIMKRLNSGTVYWNCCDRVSPYLPWTGRKASGIGSTLSHIGIKSFLQPKAWHLKQVYSSKARQFSQ